MSEYFKTLTINIIHLVFVGVCVDKKKKIHEGL